uniref:Potassium channel toxin alpha-KTx n=1 Tax=Hoffmannihadrurus gertschi TaxID=380989 RepID=KAXU2_HOFGE|nr:RecName: Full=Potassium channel toxin alpha-KTx; Flags: Precursor [Hadrurus gertschi]
MKNIAMKTTVVLTILLLSVLTAINADTMKKRSDYCSNDFCFFSCRRDRCARGDCENGKCVCKNCHLN